MYPSHHPAQPTQGTQRGSALAFKLDTLLKLADVKGTDRRTSLLHWVVQYLLKQDPDFKDMPNSLHATVPAAGVQMHAVKALLGELKGGLQRVKSEIMAAMLEGSGAHEVFSRKMVPFHAAAERDFAAVEVRCKHRGAF